MADDAAHLQQLRKASKAASKAAAKKERRAQRSIDERGTDDPKTKELVDAARAATARSAELRRELEEREGDGGEGSASDDPPDKAGDVAKSNGPRGKRFSCIDPKTKLDLAAGLVLHENVISPAEEIELVDFVNEQCARGRRGELRKPTYLRASGERSRGNQREAIMYGGFFDFNRARPGRRDLVPPFPPILHRLVARLVDERKILPADVRPDSVIINRYDKGDCIPPHVDHPSYPRPISTLSLLGEEPMLIGSRFKTVRACEWKPTTGMAVRCPRRSILILGGNSGNVAQHCISACSGPRISITLRKQPPPDWRPDVSELVGGKKNGEKEQGGETKGSDGAGAKKRKALSGSAKRRKKMAKMSSNNR